MAAHAVLLRSDCMHTAMPHVLSHLPHMLSHLLPVPQVIRYPWYALSGIDRCPQWLTWLRWAHLDMLEWVRGRSKQQATLTHSVQLGSVITNVSGIRIWTCALPILT